LYTLSCIEVDPDKLGLPKIHTFIGVQKSDHRKTLSSLYTLGMFVTLVGFVVSVDRIHGQLISHESSYKWGGGGVSKPPTSGSG